MTILSKTAAGLSLVSCLSDIHRTALISSKNEGAKYSANSYIECSLGTQKANSVSAKDASRKNWLAQKNLLGGPCEFCGKVSGYVKGALGGIIRYIPNFILSAVAIAAKSKRVSNISAIGLAGIELVDFLKNSTSLFKKTDYLK